MAVIRVKAVEAFRNEPGRAKIVDYGIKEFASKKDGKDVLEAKAFIETDDGLPEITWRLFDFFTGKSLIFEDKDGFKIKDTHKQVFGQILMFLQKLKIDSDIDLDPASYMWKTVPVDLIGHEIEWNIVSQPPKKILLESGKYELQPNPFVDIIITGLDIVSSKGPERKDDNTPVKAVVVDNVAAWKDFLTLTLTIPKTDGEINDAVTAYTVKEPEKGKLLKGRKRVLSTLVADKWLVYDEETDKYSKVAV